MCEVGQKVAGLFVANDRADRQLDDHVTAMLTRAVRSHSVLAAAGAPVALKLEVIQRVQTFRSEDEYRSATSAVTAGRAATGNIFFAAKGDTAVAAVTGLDADRRLIDEHRCLIYC